MSQLRTLVNSNDHMLGNANAPVELVEYGDFECPIVAALTRLLKTSSGKWATN